MKSRRLLPANGTCSIKLFPEKAPVPDAAQCSAKDFSHQAKMAMAAKLYEMGKLSSGMAAQMGGIGRVEFLLQLSQYGVAMINLDQDDLLSDVNNA